MNLRTKRTEIQLSSAVKVTVPRVATLGLALVSSATEARNLILQDGGGDEQAQLDGQAI
jgi:hypothetical protein